MLFGKESFGPGVPTFDIFRGHYSDKEATWVEAVEGFDKARDRMRQIAAEKRGPYFVYSCSDRLVLDIANTTWNLERRSAKHQTAGAG